MESSSGFTFLVLYMMVRARTVSPTHRLSGSRRWAGMLAWISGESTLAEEPGARRVPEMARVHADQDVGRRLVALRLQALEERPGSPPKLFTAMPVFLVKASIAGSCP